jgi:hypothetical protein
MASIVPQMSLFLGIIPALLLLWIGLRGYEGLYKDKTIFLMFIVGIITGFIAALIELISASSALVFFIILFPILEQLFKTIILNLGRFHEKRETVIYGLSLGLGFGSVFTPASLLLVGSKITDTLTILLIVIGSFGIIMYHAAAGLLIGYGVFTNRAMTYLFLSIVFELPITVTSFITVYYNMTNLQFLIVIYGAIVFWFAVYRIMPRIRDDLERRKRTLKTETVKT